MRKFLTLITVIFFSSSFFGQVCVGPSDFIIDCGLLDNCSNTPDYDNNGVADDIRHPSVSTDHSCQDAVSSYLARTIVADNLQTLIMPIPCYGLDPLPPSTAIVNCNPEDSYALCSTNYCPETYCNQLKSFVEMEVTFVARASSAWYNEAYFYEGERAFDAAAQLVCDINSVFDCNNLPRPIIQAGIYEGVTPEVENIEIPDWVLSAFPNYSPPNDHFTHSVMFGGGGRKHSRHNSNRNTNVVLLPR